MNIVSARCVLDTWSSDTKLLIQQIGLAPLFEGREVGLPPLRNLSRVFLVFKRPHRIHVRNQMLCLCHCEIRLKMMQCTDQLNSQFRRIERAPVCHRKGDSRQRLPMERKVVRVFRH